MRLEHLAVEHYYYCSDNNYFSNDAGAEWDCVDDFLEEFDNADVDMNMVFRFDVREIEDDDGKQTGKYYAQVFMMHQRKGIFASHYIKQIEEKDVEKFSSYLQKHYDYIKNLWEPFNNNETK